MIFKFDDFKVETKKEIEKLSEQIAVPAKIKNDKLANFSWQYKTKEVTVFVKLFFLEEQDNTYYKVIDNIFNFIDFIEILKAFTSNKLDTSKEYNINNKFTAKTAQKNEKISLKIHFKNYSNSLYLDKFECSSLAAKFTKILNRCDLWQEQQV